LLIRKEKSNLKKLKKGAGKMPTSCQRVIPWGQHNFKDIALILLYNKEISKDKRKSP
jgi:hypothetical protein